MGPEPRFEERTAGLFVVHYDSGDQMAPERQAALVEAVKRVSKQRRTGIVFVLGPALKNVPLNVPAFWLQVTADVPFVALAVASPSLAVKVATTGFRMANVLRNVPLQVHSCLQEDEAVSWVQERLSK